MHRSRFNSLNLFVPGALALVAALPFTAGGRTLDARAAEVSVLPASTSAAGLPSLRTQGQDTANMVPDQKFLRESSDEREGLAMVAHAALHRPGTFPSKTDAQKLDRRVDDELDRLRTALKGIYNDTYAPKARPMAHNLADSLSKLTGATYDSTFRKWVIEYDRLEILGIDRVMPKLTNADVKALAQKMRASAASEMAALKAEMAAA